MTALAPSARALNKSVALRQTAPSTSTGTVPRHRLNHLQCSAGHPATTARRNNSTPSCWLRPLPHTQCNAMQRPGSGPALPLRLHAWRGPRQKIPLPAPRWRGRLVKQHHSCYYSLYRLARTVQHAQIQQTHTVRQSSTTRHLIGGNGWTAPSRHGRRYSHPS